MAGERSTCHSHLHGSGIVGRIAGAATNAALQLLITAYVRNRRITRVSLIELSQGK
jgi:hypothetical protein